MADPALDAIAKPSRQVKPSAHGKKRPHRATGLRRNSRPGNGWITVREALDLRGLTAPTLAFRLSQGVAWMDSEDLAERALGVRVLKLALEVRGDLIRQATVTLPSPPANLDVLVRVLHELRSLPPPPVVVSDRGIVDVTPLPAQAPEKTGEPS